MKNRIQEKLEEIKQGNIKIMRELLARNIDRAGWHGARQQEDIKRLQVDLKTDYHIIPKTDDMGQVMEDGFTQGMYFGSQSMAEKYETIKANMLDTPSLLTHIFDVLEDLRNRDDFDYERDGLAVEDFQDSLRNMKPIEQGDTP